MMSQQFELENLQKEFNKINKQVVQLKIAKQDASEMIAKTEEVKQKIAEKDVEAKDFDLISKHKISLKGHIKTFNNDIDGLEEDDDPASKVEQDVN
ncbi:hypothetical protein V6N11_080615 [Hibiscus sabdariffa]|uniref:Serine-tRNA synthetase type1 N-terminal domain-containing protein n=1 Tax=Hibiscus sabdariffa TaxID=183260 RepID=A0ABR2R882_9ROSI